MSNTTNTTPAADAAKAEAPKARKGHLAVILPDGTVAYRKTDNKYAAAVAGLKDGVWSAVSWHGTIQHAKRASQTGRFTAVKWDGVEIVPVVATAAKAAKATKATASGRNIDRGAAPAADREVKRSMSTVSKDGEMTCRACDETMPVTKFPTTRDKDGNVTRVDRCRACRDAAAEARKAAKA